jgi:hypothetical protein
MANPADRCGRGPKSVHQPPDFRAERQLNPVQLPLRKNKFKEIIEIYQLSRLAVFASSLLFLNGRR